MSDMTLLRFCHKMVFTRALCIVAALTVVAGCAGQEHSFLTDSTSATNKVLPALTITSPRHPATFYLNGNDKLSQDLRWDTETQTLCAYVTYSEVAAGDAELDPANYKTFTLPFPTVRLDQNGNLYVVDSHLGKVILGQLEDDPGKTVLLGHDVKLSAHRTMSHLTAKLIVYEK